MSTKMSAVHAAADALADYARETFWRSDSGFHQSSRYNYEAAAAWLHQYAAGVDPGANPDDLVHLFAPSGESLAACTETDAVSTAVLLDAVTCGWCRVKASTTSPPASNDDQEATR